MLHAVTTIIYRIDELGQLVWANDTWDTFAQENGSVGVNRSRLYGRNLFDFVSDPVVRQIYTAIIGRARSGRAVRFRYRCDAPTRRREFEMEIHASSLSEVEFASTLIQETERAAVSLFDVTPAAAEGEMLRLCSWCHAVSETPGRWIPLEEAIQSVWVSARPRVSHGICPACVQKMLAQLDRPGASSSPCSAAATKA